MLVNIQRTSLDYQEQYRIYFTYIKETIADHRKKLQDFGPKKG